MTRSGHTGFLASWLPEHDPHVNAMESKGTGEFSVVGTVAAVTNAMWHA
ncbi:hypothetical protein ACWFR5_45575 [Streptomyces sp. NPDC055092]